MITATYSQLTDLEKQQIRTFGCTIEQMRHAIVHSGHRTPSKIVMSIINYTIDHLSREYECGEVDWMSREDARQALNRAKWILENYSDWNF